MPQQQHSRRSLFRAPKRCRTVRYHLMNASTHSLWIDKKQFIQEIERKKESRMTKREKERFRKHFVWAVNERFYAATLCCSQKKSKSFFFRGLESVYHQRKKKKKFAVIVLFIHSSMICFYAAAAATCKHNIIQYTSLICFVLCFFLLSLQRVFFSRSVGLLIKTFIYYGSVASEHPFMYQPCVHSVCIENSFYCSGEEIFSQNGAAN